MTGDKKLIVHKVEQMTTEKSTAHEINVFDDELFLNILSCALWKYLYDKKKKKKRKSLLLPRNVLVYISSEMIIIFLEGNSFTWASVSENWFRSQNFNFVWGWKDLSVTRVI